MVAGEEGSGGYCTLFEGNVIWAFFFLQFADTMRKAAQFPHQAGLFIGAFASLPCTNSVEIRIRVTLFWVFFPFSVF